MVECPKCKGKTIKIMGELYCPTCFAKTNKANKGRYLSSKRTLVVVGFGLVSLSIVAAFFSVIFAVMFSTTAEWLRFGVFILAVMCSFFVGGSIIYLLDSVNYILDSLFLLTVLIVTGAAVVAALGLDGFNIFLILFFDIYLFAIFFLTGAFLINHFKNR
jgi:hypothetical protein